MDDIQIAALLQRIDGTGSDDEWAAVEELRTLGTALPRLLLQQFRASKGWRIRSACVYHAIRYARESEDAVSLGLEALGDKSKVVRYRGAMLLAYSQRKDVVPSLRKALAGIGQRRGAEDIFAAIDAIESGDHNLFVDREHSGKIKLTIS